MKLCIGKSQLDGAPSYFEQLRRFWLRGVILDYEFVNFKGRRIFLTHGKLFTVTQVSPTINKNRCSSTHKNQFNHILV